MIQWIPRALKHLAVGVTIVFGLNLIAQLIFWTGTHSVETSFPGSVDSRTLTYVNSLLSTSLVAFFAMFPVTYLLAVIDSLASSFATLKREGVVECGGVMVTKGPGAYTTIMKKSAAWGFWDNKKESKPPAPKL